MGTEYVKVNGNFQSCLHEKIIMISNVVRSCFSIETKEHVYIRTAPSSLEEQRFFAREDQCGRYANADDSSALLGLRPFHIRTNDFSCEFYVC